MSKSTTLFSGGTVANCPSPNTLTPVNPILNTVTQDWGRAWNDNIINPAYVANASAQNFFMVSGDYRDEETAFDIRFFPSVTGATYEVTVWKYSHNAFLNSIAAPWTKINPSGTGSVTLTGAAQLPLSQIDNDPIVIQVNAISSGTLTIEIDAEGRVY